MKTLILFFSQTGHTRNVADVIRNGIIEGGGHCDLLPLADADPECWSTYDLIGLGCPVFYFREPINVGSFIDRLPDLPDRPWFVFCTHGSIVGDTLRRLTEALERKSITVIGHHHTYADATLPFYPYPTLTTGHPDADDLRAAFDFGRTLTKRYREVVAGRTDAIPPAEPVPDEWRQNADRFTPEFLARVFPPLSIDLDRCSLCGDCEQGCPVGGINLGIDPPSIQQPCVYCWYCVNICPEKAVVADWEPQVQLAPKLYQRYRYWLDRAVAEGSFRWRIDPDRLDFDRPLYRQPLKKT
jgi:flavodoxin/NAD-dependent dihydropyrimidine dehydrogenase PreA subunit